MQWAPLFVIHYEIIIKTSLSVAVVCVCVFNVCACVCMSICMGKGISALVCVRVSALVFLCRTFQGQYVGVCVCLCVRLCVFVSVCL